MTGTPRDTDPRRLLGAHGEARVARWYRQRGYDVLDRNWRSPDGELDLVVARDGVVVFCEVKTRSGVRFGSPVEAVTRHKQARIRRLAAQWLRVASRQGWPAVRFDVAAVHGPSIDVIEAAF